MEVQTTHRSDSTILVLSGSLDEKSQFPAITVAFAKTIILDLGEIKTVNSLGIQRWVNWLGTIPFDHQLRLINCAPSIVLQFNMIDSFLTGNSQVLSVMVPFFCNIHEEEFTVKFTIGNDLVIENGRVEVVKNVTVCPQNDGCQVEHDILPEKYFRFLTR